MEPGWVGAAQGGTLPDAGLGVSLTYPGSVDLGLELVLAGLAAVAGLVNLPVDIGNVGRAVGVFHCGPELDQPLRHGAIGVVVGQGPHLDHVRDAVDLAGGGVWFGTLALPGRAHQHVIVVLVGVLGGAVLNVAIGEVLSDTPGCMSGSSHLHSMMGALAWETTSASDGTSWACTWAVRWINAVEIINPAARKAISPNGRPNFRYLLIMVKVILH
jgi:hypothetical protein